ncbi:hypothetical protein PR048_015444 [Dryococelus australis]|uniref:Uncharacterized protein n=1 Tax=Dryococelus australis TaxID=614101 RepID=A0ABQ9HH91_9NEOP|nr:hypothetical protein PR048_015444 [Dryococelus australis]
MRNRLVNPTTYALYGIGVSGQPRRWFIRYPEATGYNNCWPLSRTEPGQRRQVREPGRTTQVRQMVFGELGKQGVTRRRRPAAEWEVRLLSSAHWRARRRHDIGDQKKKEFVTSQLKRYEHLEARLLTGAPVNEQTCEASGEKIDGGVCIFIVVYNRMTAPVQCSFPGRWRRSSSRCDRPPLADGATRGIYYPCRDATPGASERCVVSGGREGGLRGPGEPAIGGGLVPRGMQITPDYSPPTQANRARLPAGSLQDFRMWESCRTMPLVGWYSRGSPALLHTHVVSPTSALKTPMLRAAQISPLHSSCASHENGLTCCSSVSMDEIISRGSKQSLFTRRANSPFTVLILATLTKLSLPRKTSTTRAMHQHNGGTLYIIVLHKDKSTRSQVVLWDGAFSTTLQCVKVLTMPPLPEVLADGLY